jgi:hypothetical protein
MGTSLCMFVCGGWAWGVLWGRGRGVGEAEAGEGSCLRLCVAQCVSVRVNA